jgi:hypothetical protein
MQQLHSEALVARAASPAGIDAEPIATRQEHSQSTSRSDWPTLWRYSMLAESCCPYSHLYDGKVQENRVPLCVTQIVTGCQRSELLRVIANAHMANKEKPRKLAADCEAILLKPWSGWGSNPRPPACKTASASANRRWAPYFSTTYEIGVLVGVGQKQRGL